MPNISVKTSTKCRKCRGTIDCTDLDDNKHKSCKCDIDFRRRVLVKDTLKEFLKKRCCTEGAANTLLKGDPGRIREGLEALLAPACETCDVSTIGNGGWQKSRSFCNFQCCPSLNSPCLMALLVLCRTHPNRLKFDQAAELEDIILTPEGTTAAAKEDAFPQVLPYSTEDATIVCEVDMSGVEEAIARENMSVQSPLEAAATIESAKAAADAAIETMLDGIIADSGDETPTPKTTEAMPDQRSSTPLAVPEVVPDAAPEAMPEESEDECGIYEMYKPYHYTQEVYPNIV